MKMAVFAGLMFWAGFLLGAHLRYLADQPDPAWWTHS